MARQVLVVVAGLAGLAAPTVAAQAGSEVTDGTETALDSALAAGGPVSFNCHGTHAPARLPFTIAVGWLYAHLWLALIPLRQEAT